MGMGGLSLPVPGSRRVEKTASSLPGAGDLLDSSTCHPFSGSAPRPPLLPGPAGIPGDVGSCSPQFRFRRDLRAEQSLGSGVGSLQPGRRTEPGVGVGEE